MNKQLLLSILLLSILVGCVTGPVQYRKQLKPWKGKPEDWLLNSWGEPFKTSYSDGAKYISFQDGTANKSTDPQSGCITTFIIIDGKVDNYEIEGNDCGVDIYMDMTK